MSDLRCIKGVWYDFGCKNESFLITAKELQTLGIKIFYFMLRFDNPKVADIDPFKPNLSEQEATALMIEYKNNIWMFARTAVRMRTDKGDVPFGLHRGLAAALWNFEHNQDFCLNEPRQTWKTTGTLGGCVLWAFQLSRNLKIHFFGKEMMGKLKSLVSLLRFCRITYSTTLLQFTRKLLACPRHKVWDVVALAQSCTSMRLSTLRSFQKYWRTLPLCLRLHLKTLKQPVNPIVVL